ncbi:hypothetical protein WDU94_001465 [Cyamophila willieti]
MFTFPMSLSVMMAVLLLAKSGYCHENNTDCDCDCDNCDDTEGSLYTFSGTLEIKPSPDNKGKLWIQSTHFFTLENHSPDQRPIEYNETVLVGHLSNVLTEGENISFTSNNKKAEFVDNTKYDGAFDIKLPLHNFTNNVPVKYKSPFIGIGNFTAVLTHTETKDDDNDNYNDHDSAFDSGEFKQQIINIDAHVEGSADKVLMFLFKDATMNYSLTSNTTLYVNEYWPDDYFECVNCVDNKYVVQKAFSVVDTTFNLLI